VCQTLRQHVWFHGLNCNTLNYTLYIYMMHFQTIRTLLWLTFIKDLCFVHTDTNRSWFLKSTLALATIRPICVFTWRNCRTGKHVFLSTFIYINRTRFSLPTRFAFACPIGRIARFRVSQVACACLFTVVSIKSVFTT